MKALANFVGFLANLFLVSILLFLLVGIFAALQGERVFDKPPKHAIVQLELSGVILDGKSFLKDLRKYRKLPEVGAIVIRINSPGGVVGPSQEIYQEIKKTRTDFGKPVVASCNGLAASGAFYAAVGADYIVTNPGAILGSIGVIWEMANLEKLYEWAKIKRYSIKTGPYKDMGSDYRAMTDDERRLIEGTMQEVLGQFKRAIAEGRKVTLDEVTQIADGRVFTGESAVKMKMADEIGTLTDAIKKAKELGRLPDDAEVFEPPRTRSGIMSWIQEANEESSSSLAGLTKKFLGQNLTGHPLFLMPGALLGEVED